MVSLDRISMGWDPKTTANHTWGYCLLSHITSGFTKSSQFYKSLVMRRYGEAVVEEMQVQTEKAAILYTLMEE